MKELNGAQITEIAGGADGPISPARISQLNGEGAWMGNPWLGYEVDFYKGFIDDF